MTDFPAGWPRPFIERRDMRAVGVSPEVRAPIVKTPALWIGGFNQAQGDWLSFDESRSDQARYERLCVVCGEALGTAIILGHVATFTTDGPPAHPRCFALALRFCPRYSQRPYTRARQTVAYVHNARPDDLFAWVNRHDIDDWGSVPLVRRQVRAMRRHEVIALAKSDPLGVSAYGH